MACIARRLATAGSVPASTRFNPARGEPVVVGARRSVAQCRRACDASRLDGRELLAGDPACRLVSSLETVGIGKLAESARSAIVLIGRLATTRAKGLLTGLSGGLQASLVRVPDCLLRQVAGEMLASR
jgi:hypothetical protein